jgi:ribonuclease HI
LEQTPEQCGFPAMGGRPDGADDCWRRIWAANVPPKVKNFAWKAASNALSTEVNKRSRGFQVTGQCIICGMEQEDSGHALFRCPHANQLWSVMRDIWLLPGMHELCTITGTWLRLVIVAAQPQMIESILLVAWQAWYAHNEVTHAKPLPSVDRSKGFLVSYMRTIRNVKELSTDDIIKGKNTLVCSASCVPTRKEPPDKIWLKPSEGWVKLNCDGSFKLEDGSAGVDMVLRDKNGQVIFSACRQLNGCSDALEAETLACQEGLLLAFQWSEKPVIVVLDCSSLVEALTKDSQDRSSITYLISEIKVLARGNRLVSFVKVDRTQNRASHTLANLARVEGTSGIWHGTEPECLIQVLAHDLIVTHIV